MKFLRPQILFLSLLLAIACGTPAESKPGEHPPTGNIESANAPQVNSLATPFAVGITTPLARAMYLRCCNVARFDVPPDYRDVKFESDGATILDTDDPLVKLILPDSNQFRVLVTAVGPQDRHVAHEERFISISPPKPKIVFLVNGEKHDGIAVVSKKAITTIRLEADPAFHASWRKDARYAFYNIRVLAQRSLGEPAELSVISGGGVDPFKGLEVPLADLLKQDAPGTKVMLQIEEVWRINCEGRAITEDFSMRDKCIGFVIK